MALVIADRVKETSTTTGTGTLTLGGAATGYQTFSAAIGSGNTCYYAITLDSAWEVGIGTVGTGTLTRDTILASSNAGAAVSFGAGTKDVFATYPAGRAVYKESGGNVILDVNSTSAALRITQTGSGNAIVVEDSTNPDSTPFVVDANGTVVVGSTTGYTTSGISAPGLNVVTTSSGAGAGISGWVGATAGAPNFQFMKSRGAAVGTHTVVADGDSLGIFRFSGSDGTNFISAATITGSVDGTPGTNDMPGRLVFSTTADGASTPTERFRISNFGGWGLAGANYGTSGTQAIVSNGNAAAPTWKDVVTPTASQTLTNKTYNGLTLTSAATGFTVAGGTTSKTLTVSNTLTLAGTDASTLNIGAGGTLGSAAFTASTAYAPATSGTALLKGNGSGGTESAVAGTDYVAPSGALGTPSSGTLSSCTVDGTNEVGYKNIPQNSQSAAYTLVLADAGKHILHPSADTTARVFTIPANSSVAYPIGTAITFVNQNAAGTITIAITTDTMRLAGAGTTGSRTLAANGVATAIKLTSTEWIISGTGLT